MTTVTRVPRDLSVEITDIDHGYHVSATVYVSWGNAEQAPLNGGPLTLAFWPDSLVMYTPSGSGSNSNLRFYLRNVAYNVRAEYQRQADGSWRLSPGHYDRSEWTKVADMRASDAARRDLAAILEEVGRLVVEARPDLFLAGAVAKARQEANSAAATVERLRKELAEAEATSREAEVALTLALSARDTRA